MNVKNTEMNLEDTSPFADDPFNELSKVEISKIQDIQELVPQSTNMDMLQKVRKTAKWSQLYKSGTSFPPKHKVLFINQDEDNTLENNEIVEIDKSALPQVHKKGQSRDNKFNLMSHTNYEDSLMKSGTGMKELSSMQRSQENMDKTKLNPYANKDLNADQKSRSKAQNESHNSTDGEAVFIPRGDGQIMLT